MPSWLAWALGAVVLACAAGLVLLAVLGGGGATGGGGSTPNPQASAELSAYTAALGPPTQEGGRIVEQEMKPSLAEFERGVLDAATFASRAGGWQLAFQRIRRQIDRIPVPTLIPAAGGLFDAAIDAYIRTAQLLEAAARAPGSARQAAIEAAVDAARAADSAYDRAAAVVQRALRAAGLPPDNGLPDPSPG
jgi:hypothetical protein